MKKHRISTKRLKAWIKDEHMATKEYKLYGMTRLSANENLHHKVLSRMLKNRI